MPSEAPTILSCSMGVDHPVGCPSSRSVSAYLLEFLEQQLELVTEVSFDQISICRSLMLLNDKDLACVDLFSEALGEDSLDLVNSHESTLLVVIFDKFDDDLQVLQTCFFGSL